MRESQLPLRYDGQPLTIQYQQSNWGKLEKQSNYPVLASQRNKT